MNNVYIKTGSPIFDNFYPKVKSFLEKDLLEVNIEGQKIRGYRPPDAKSIWIRDYSDMMRGIKYFESDLKSVVDHFAENQSDSGRVFDYFTTFPEKLPSERENWTKYVRVPVEADVEFRFVKAAHTTWQATGDDEWFINLLPKLEKALNYILSHPHRWDAEHGLVKRAYTIDTWDFAYSAGKHDWLQFQIDEDTFWGIMHGDNSGYYEAFHIVGDLNELADFPEKAQEWHHRAEELKTNMNKFCWNGTFYRHFLKLTPLDLPEVDENNQLSLSNPMDINRGVTSHEMAVSILKEYQRRRDTTDAFAEWFSIEPPFPAGFFGEELLVEGAYANGGIMPLVGGELARAAFEHGFEAYGVDILGRYYKIISEHDETYLWYFPDGTAASVETSTSPEAEPTDGWGSSAMLYALMEGLAGVVDKNSTFSKVHLSPRWSAAGVKNAEVRVEYAASESWLKYIYQMQDEFISVEVYSKNCLVEFHILLPSGSNVLNILAGNNIIDFETVKVETSLYIDFKMQVEDSLKIKINLSSDANIQ